MAHDIGPILEDWRPVSHTQSKAWHTLHWAVHKSRGRHWRHGHGVFVRLWRRQLPVHVHVLFCQVFFTIFRFISIYCTKMRLKHCFFFLETSHVKMCKLSRNDSFKRSNRFHSKRNGKTLILFLVIELLSKSRRRLTG